MIDQAKTDGYCPPAILTTRDEIDVCLEADTPDALALQTPLPDGALHIVARGEKEDCQTSHPSA
jgi:hypothetical protein